MLKNINILSLKKQLLCSFVFLGLTAISFASVSMGNDGGGGDKPKSPLGVAFGFSPVKPQNCFTLKAGPNYRANSIFTESKAAPFVLVNSVVSFQKGNTTYIIPYKHKVSITAAKSNLQAVNVKVNFNR